MSEGSGAPDGERASKGERARKRASADPIRVLIADDHALFRRGLEMVLADEPDIELVGQASDGAEAVARAVSSFPTWS